MDIFSQLDQPIIDRLPFYEKTYTLAFFEGNPVVERAAKGLANSVVSSYQRNRPKVALWGVCFNLKMHKR